MNTPTLETERLIVRKFTENDMVRRRNREGMGRKIPPQGGARAEGGSHRDREDNSSRALARAKSLFPWAMT